jgi:hypothetical protein
MRALCDDAVEAGSARNLPRFRPAPRGPTRPDTLPAPPGIREVAIKLAGNTAIMRLVRQGVDFP